MTTAGVLSFRVTVDSAVSTTGLGTLTAESFANCWFCNCNEFLHPRPPFSRTDAEVVQYTNNFMVQGKKLNLLIFCRFKSDLSNVPQLPSSSHYVRIYVHIVCEPHLWHLVL